LNKKMATGLVLVFAAIMSLAAISVAQLGDPWTGPYSTPDYESWPNPWEDYSWQDQWPTKWDTPYNPMTEPVSEPSGMSSEGSHPNTGPGGSEPLSSPSASTGSPISYLDDGASLSESEVRSLPGGSSLVTPSGGLDTPLTSTGSPGALSIYSGGAQDRYGRYYGGTQAYYGGYYGGIQQWIYYSGRWSYGPAAMWFGQRTNTIIRTDQSQWIWSYERYPNGYEQWQYWGYWYPGYHHAWFGADARGWHQIAIWGSRSGWSNPIWIYVW